MFDPHRRAYPFLIICASLIWLLGGIDIGHAAKDHPPRIFLPALIQELIEQNPDIKAARKRWEAARAVPSQEESLPDPIVTFGYRGDDIMNEGRLFLRQDFPFPGKLSLRGDIASREADRLEQEYLATSLRLMARVKEAYYELHFVHDAIEIVEKNKILLEQFEKTAEARYSVGQTAQQDVFRAQVELSRVLDRLAVLEQRKESLHAAINRLLNRPPAGPLGAPAEARLTPVTQDLDQLNRWATQFSPILEATQKRIERSKQALALAQRDYFPDFFVSVGGTQGAGQRAGGPSTSGLRDAIGLVGVKVPLYYATKQRYGVEEALAGLESAREERQATHQEVLFQVKDAYVRAQRATRLVEILRDAIIPQATLALKSALAGYEVGEVDFLTLLNALLTLQENELELHGEVAAHEQAVARLVELTGGKLSDTLSTRGKSSGSSKHMP